MKNHYRNLTRLSKLLDNQINIFGFKFGLDPLIGLIPGIGDAIGLAISAYIFLVAYQMNLPKHKMVRMGFNILVDFILGLIPFFGDIGDFLYRANVRNIKIIQEHAPSYFSEQEFEEIQEISTGKV